MVLTNRTEVQRTAALLVAVLAFLEVADGVTTTRRRLARRVTAWWALVERQQRSQLRWAQASYITRLAGRRSR